MTDYCICLRQGDYSETSQVLTLLSERHGKHSVIAKGIKRGTRTRFATGVDVLEEGHCVWSPPRGDAGLGTLIEWEQMATNSHLRRGLETLNAGLYAAEAAAVLTEEADPHPATFAALRETLGALGAARSVRATLASFQIAALREVGLVPRFSECVDCRRAVGADEPIFFCSAEGGLICRDCEPALVEKRRISPAVRAAIDAGAPPEHPGSNEAFEVLNYHVEMTLGRRMRMGGLVG